MKEEFDFESIKNKAIEQLKAGKPLLGKDGAFAPTIGKYIECSPGRRDGCTFDRRRTPDG